MPVAAIKQYITQAPHVEVSNLAEYSLHASNGEPEGHEDALSHEQAAEQWGLDNMRNGDRRLLQVMRADQSVSRWIRVDRERERAVAMECEI